MKRKLKIVAVLLSIWVLGYVGLGPTLYYTTSNDLHFLNNSVGTVGRVLYYYPFSFLFGRDNWYFRTMGGVAQFWCDMDQECLEYQRQTREYFERERRLKEESKWK